jgi:riboflavin synthase
MFTGIVSDVGEVRAVTPRSGDLRRLSIACAYPRDSIALGASIACSGICLTVTETAQDGGRTIFSVDAAAETLRVTTAGDWKPGGKINLERSLKMGDELGGHLILGHVDGIATLERREDLTDSARMTLRAPGQLMRFIAPKGSVALDGVSLTVNEVGHDTFSVLIIPHTLQVTTFGALRTGARINLEVDQMARYAARLAEARG